MSFLSIFISGCCFYIFVWSLLHLHKIKHDICVSGENFVTRKISRSVAKIHLGQQESLSLGNLDSKRDWGHARDYVEVKHWCTSGPTHKLGRGRPGFLCEYSTKQCMFSHIIWGHNMQSAWSLLWFSAKRQTEIEQKGGAGGEGHMLWGHRLHSGFPQLTRVPDPSRPS